MKSLKKSIQMGATPTIFRYAAKLRRNPTKAEALLWKRLRKNQIEGVHFRRQHPFSKYIPDFYAHSIKLVIEVDGSIHDEKSVKFYDEQREENLKSFGLHIIRFSNRDVLEFEDRVVEEIRQKVIELLNLRFQIIKSQKI